MLAKLTNRIKQVSEKLSEDDVILAELQQTLANARAEQGIVDGPEPQALKVRPVTVLSEEEQECRRLEHERRDEELRDIQKRERWKAFVSQCGRRYADCTLDSFQVDGDLQREVVAEMRGYLASLKERVRSGMNLILFGPKGTGKDHLLCAMAREAIQQGAELAWWNGMDLFGEVRDRITAGRSERDFIESLAKPHILYISDPLPPVGALTEFQIQTLFRVLDARYRQVRSVWCSINVAGPEEAELRLGPQNADRLRDGALALYCNWPSYRKSL